MSDNSQGNIEREITWAEWAHIQNARAATELLGGDNPAPWDMMGMAREVVRLREQLAGAVDRAEVLEAALTRVLASGVLWMRPDLQDVVLTALATREQ